MDSDGAAALVLVSGEKALKLGLQVIAKITGYADAAQVLSCLCRSKLVIMVTSTQKYYKWQMNASHTIHFNLYYPCKFHVPCYLMLIRVYCTGTGDLYNSSSPGNSQSYFKCWSGCFSN